MAAKRVFSTAKNKPHNSPSHPLIPDNSDDTAADPQPKNPPITPQKHNHTVPADPQPHLNNSPPSVGCDEVDEATRARTRVRTFNGKRPIITKKRKFDSSDQQVEKPASACPQPNLTHPPLNSTPPENTSRPVPPSKNKPSPRCSAVPCQQSGCPAAIKQSSSSSSAIKLSCSNPSAIELSCSTAFKHPCSSPTAFKHPCSSPSAFKHPCSSPSAF